MISWNVDTITTVTFVAVSYKMYTVEPQLSGPHLSRFLVNQTTEVTALLEQ